MDHQINLLNKQLAVTEKKKNSSFFDFF